MIVSWDADSIGEGGVPLFTKLIQIQKNYLDNLFLNECGK